MDIRNIGVMVDVNGIDQDLLALAVDMAQTNKATLMGLGASAPPMVLGAMEGFDVGGAIYADQYAEVEATIKAAAESFGKLVPEGIKHRWEGVVQRPDYALIDIARNVDLMIVGQALAPTTSNEFDLGSVLLGCGRPVLLPARGLRQLKYGKALIAWKDTKESRRAIVDALPLLKRVEEVTVLVVDEGDLAGEQESMADVIAWLRSHDINAHGDVMAATGGVSATIERTAERLHADLVVAGAYGHSRLREWMFGGVTRTLIHDAGYSRLLSN